MNEQILHDQITQAQRTLIKLIYTDWITIDLFSPRWFGTVAVIVFSYALVFWFLDKRRFTQLLLFGSLMTVMVTLLDVVGANYGLWLHTVRIIPTTPSLFWL